jgi:hypothetical protein
VSSLEQKSKQKFNKISKEKTTTKTIKSSNTNSIHPLQTVVVDAWPVF